MNTLTLEEKKTFENLNLRLLKVGKFPLRERHPKTFNHDFRKLKDSFPPLFQIWLLRWCYMDENVLTIFHPFKCQTFKLCVWCIFLTMRHNLYLIALIFWGGIVRVVTINKINITLVIINVDQLFVLDYCRFYLNC